MAVSIKDRWQQLMERLTQSSLVVRARTLFESLSPRDRRLFIMLMSFFVVVGISGAVYSARQYEKRLEQDIARKQEQLARVLDVRVEHENLKTRIAAREEELKRNPDFNLTSFLEREANTVGFTQPVNIQSKGDVANDGFREITADVKIRKADLPKIVDYLHRIETAPHRLTVKELRIRTTFGSKSELDADLEVSHLAPQET